MTKIWELFTMAWKLASLVLAVNFLVVVSQDYEIKECITDRELKTVDVKCPDNTRIRLDETIYGISKWVSSTECSLAVGDCSEKIDLFNSCDGKNECSVILTKTYSAKCGGYATFLRVLYDCQPELNTVTATEVVTRTNSETNNNKLWSPPIAIRDDTPSLTPDNETSADEIGLIAGCVVAVIITVLMLLFAIYLVVKRLCRPPQDEEINQENVIHQKPDIVIYDLVCCCLPRPEPEKPRPVADQNQNIQNSAQLRISDRPVPIGEVTAVTVNEFNQPNPPIVSNESSRHQTSAQSANESRQSNTSAMAGNSAVGLPNTRTTSAC
ncbi:hypothetical protein LOTGIDRAFT_232715 [Lottia gigantea]|uniref:SUEL-type lectin domain-containing protein n=1 Tax=Lottia gigantea TaxID=225164 RepID=V3ZPD6_LOTGI|nr:hypothetical protein LOTGIDRAFT_232715 [Lottia gigantea]ESO93273.1 hypothetical protein LOTGIDRAFT_232715 [Lottia gigantea]